MLAVRDSLVTDNQGQIEKKKEQQHMEILVVLSFTSRPSESEKECNKFVKEENHWENVDILLSITFYGWGA